MSVSFAIYLIGYALFIIGICYAAVLLHVPSQWVAVGAIILIGLGIFTGVKSTRTKDSN